MERISEKDKDIKGRMRPGSIFTSSRDDGLRYVDKDGSEAWTTPNSRYYASETILRGQAVSIAQLDDLNKPLNEIDEIDGKTMAEDKYAYVKITDPDLDSTCLGVAMSYAEKGDIVHVQSRGKFSYYTTQSSYYKDPNSRRRDKEVFLNADKDGEWNISKVRGQAIYVKKVVEDPDAWETGHDTEDEIQSTDVKNNFTYDLDDSIYNARNTIQLGYLVDAPTEKDEDEDQIVTIELNVTGDTRGPIDNTSFLMKLGEDIYFKYNKDKNIDYSKDTPDYNVGIRDELKVVSLAGEDAHPASFTITTRTEVSKESLGNNVPKNAFIAVRKLDGSTIFTPVFGPLDLNGIVVANDKGYISLSRAFAGNVDPEYPIITEIEGASKNIPELESYEYVEGTKHILMAKESVDIIDTDIVADIIKRSLNMLTLISAEYNSEEVEWKPSILTNIGNDGRIITAGIIDGYYDVYVSKELLPYISIKQRRHGQSAPKGSAILADVRDANRLNIVGVVVSNQEGLHKKGETIRVMKMGRITTKGEVLVGKQFYLGLNGRITTRQQYWYDYNAPIGIAESPHYFIVDCHLPQKDYDGAFPLGFVKPSPYGVAEKGFVLMDGYTVLNKKDWPELYEALKQWYGEDALKPSNRTSEAGPLIKELRKDFLSATKEVIDDFEMADSGTVKERVDVLEKGIGILMDDFKQHEEDHTLTDEDIEKGFTTIDHTMNVMENNLRGKITSDVQDARTYAYEITSGLQKNLDKSVNELSTKQANLTNKVISVKKDVDNNTTLVREANLIAKNNEIKIGDLQQNVDKKADSIDFDNLKLTLKDSLQSLSEDVSNLKSQDLKDLKDTVDGILDRMKDYAFESNTEALKVKLEELDSTVQAILKMIEIGGGEDSIDDEISE